MSSREQLRALYAPFLVWVAPALGPFLVAVAYYLGAEAAFLVGTLSDRIFAPFWPPNVIFFCALVFAPHRRWWLYIAFSFPAHACGIERGYDLAATASGVCDQLLDCGLNAFGIRYFLGEPPWFDNFHKAILYVVLTAVVSPAIVAFGGGICSQRRDWRSR